MSADNPRPNRFGYLRGNQPSRPEDRTVSEQLQRLARSGQIPAATPSDLARRQIERFSQDPLTQNEDEMRRRGRRVRPRKKSTRKNGEVSSYDRQFFGHEE